MADAKRGAYVARAISGIGSSIHDFSIVVEKDQKAMELPSLVRGVFEPLASLYSPVMLRRVEQPARTTRLYLTADNIPHFPYRSLRELEWDYRRGNIEKGRYEYYKQLFEEATNFGVTLPFLVYYARNGFYGFTLPVMVDPKANKLNAFINYPPDLLEDDRKKLLEEVISNYLVLFNRYLKSIRIVGYVPNTLMDNPALLIDTLFLYFHFLPIEIAMRQQYVEQFKALPISRAYIGAPLNAGKEIMEYYVRNIMPDSVTCTREVSTLPGINSATGLGYLARVSILENLVFSTVNIPDFPGIANPSINYIRYIIENGYTIKDVLYNSQLDEVIRNFPENTYSYSSLLFRDAKSVQDIEYRLTSNGMILSAYKGQETPYDIFHLIVTRMIFYQLFPMYFGRDNLQRLLETYETFEKRVDYPYTLKQLQRYTTFVDTTASDLLFELTKDVGVSLGSDS